MKNKEASLRLSAIYFEECWLKDRNKYFLKKREVKRIAMRKAKTTDWIPEHIAKEILKKKYNIII